MQTIITMGNRLLRAITTAFTGKAGKTMIILLLIACIAGPAWADLGDKKQQIYKNRRSLRKVRKNLTYAKVRHRDISRQLRRTQKQLGFVRSEIRTLNGEINESCSDIRRLRKELTQVQRDYAEKQSILKARLRDIYLNADNSIINVLAGSDNFNEFANSADYLGQVCDSDEQLIKALRLERDAIRFKQNQITSKYRKMLSYRGRLRERQETLQHIEDEREELLTESRREFQYYFERKCELEEHTAQLEKDVQRLIRDYQRRNRSYYGGSSTPSTSTGSYGYPVDGVITSGYGYRVHPIFGYRKFHTGIDFGAGYGSSIRAADGGTVIYAGWCGGYGNTVMIDHGRGISTLYAHCSSIHVSYGQSVSKGQTVAAVGSTGYSTGPHLHFEVRQGGEPVSPYGFIH